MFMCISLKLNLKINIIYDHHFFCRRWQYGKNFYKMQNDLNIGWWEERLNDLYGKSVSKFNFMWKIYSTSNLKAIFNEFNRCDNYCSLSVWLDISTSLIILNIFEGNFQKWSVHQSSGQINCVVHLWVKIWIAYN